MRDGLTQRRSIESSGDGRSESFHCPPTLEREHADIERELCRAFSAVSLPERDFLPVRPRKVVCVKFCKTVCEVMVVGRDWVGPLTCCGA